MYSRETFAITIELVRRVIDVGGPSSIDILPKEPRNQTIVGFPL